MTDVTALLCPLSLIALGVVIGAILISSSIDDVAKAIRERGRK